MNFEILRHMESFTQEMFNNIIAFQEKEHPAWDTSLSFDQRIAKLPLHYLIFSNPDRNPETHGPTVAHFYPLRREMRLIAHYAEQVAEQPVIVDAHARNGFIGSLLARETRGGVFGLRDPADKPNQIEMFHDPRCYRLEEGTLATFAGPADVIFSAWMPPGLQLNNEIRRLSPKLVVFIFTQHEDETTGQRQTGTDNSFGEALADDYRILEERSLTRPKDLLHEIWPDLTPNIEETRWLRILARKDVELESVGDIQVEPKYHWEEELLMAETAYAAKQEMIRRGFPPENLI